MPKVIDYPRASLRAGLQLADAVDKFAGSCSTELAAEQLGKKIGGAFTAQVSAAVKYGLLDSKAGRLSTTALYRSYKLAYTPEEEAQHLRRALLSPKLFAEIYGRFKGQALPVAHFEKLLMREFEVPDDIASRVGGYFIEGAKQAGLLSADNVLTPSPDALQSEPAEIGEEQLPPLASDESQLKGQSNGGSDPSERPAPSVITGTPGATESCQLSIRGPGVNFSIEIGGVDDLDIVKIMLRKIEKALNDSTEPS